MKLLLLLSLCLPLLVAIHFGSWQREQRRRSLDEKPIYSQGVIAPSHVLGIKINNQWGLCPKGQFRDRSGRCRESWHPEYVSCLPSAIPKNELACADGEVQTAHGLCERALSIQQVPQNSTAAVKKRKAKRKQLKRKLAQEVKDIKKIVLSDLGKEAINLPNCPQGQELNEFGDCAPIVKEVVNGTTVAKRPSRRQRIQKKLERELEKAVKKEIQNELKRKRRRNKKKVASSSAGTGAKPAEKPASENSRIDPESSPAHTAEPS